MFSYSRSVHIKKYKPTLITFIYLYIHVYILYLLYIPNLGTSDTDMCLDGVMTRAPGRLRAIREALMIARSSSMPLFVSVSVGDSDSCLQTIIRYAAWASPQACNVKKHWGKLSWISNINVVRPVVRPISLAVWVNPMLSARERKDIRVHHDFLIVTKIM